MEIKEEKLEAKLVKLVENLKFEAQSKLNEEIEIAYQKFCKEQDKKEEGELADFLKEDKERYEKEKYEAHHNSGNKKKWYQSI